MPTEGAFNVTSQDMMTIRRKKSKAYDGTEEGWTKLLELLAPVMEGQ